MGLDLRLDRTNRGRFVPDDLRLEAAKPPRRGAGRQTEIRLMRGSIFTETKLVHIEEQASGVAARTAPGLYYGTQIMLASLVDYSLRIVSRMVTGDGVDGSAGRPAGGKR
jgi:hypothetical protein